MTTSPVQRARQVAAARKVKAGEVKFPLLCAHCGSKTVSPKDLRSERVRQRDHADPKLRGKKLLFCISCGRRTPVKEAEAARDRAIRSYVEAGVDISLGTRRVTNG